MSSVRIAAGISLALAFCVALALATLRETAVSCEVCLEFEGRSACRSAAGADREAAIQSARSTACAVLASGVTRGMQCQRARPSSIACESDLESSQAR